MDPTSSPGERYAAQALDWPAVRELLLPFCPSQIGRRALAELEPREGAEASDALSRARELQELTARGEEPPFTARDDPRVGIEGALEFSRALDGEELYAVARLLRSADDLGTWLAARRSALPRCDALWAERPDLTDLCLELEQTVDRRGRVLDDASPALARLRAEIERLTREIDRVIREYANRPALRGAFSEGHAGQVHRRGGRRVLAVRQRHAGRIPGIVHDRSQSGETIFVEPRDVIEGANRLAELEADAEREANRVLAEKTRSVLAVRESIAITARCIGELELALVSARYARGVDGRPARVPGEPGAAEGMLLRTWRHPLLLAELQQERLEEVVPIDVRLCADFDLLVITGPNTGGKTLALKGAGLAALMTGMGFAIPCAEGTTVPLFDGIVADIGDEQEIQQNLSTFSSHLKRIREGLERAGPKTLFLLDELGGGTDPGEGAALGEALLEELLRRKIPALASTHLGRLKEFAFRFERAENAHVEFDVETLAPRYRLVIGAPGESRALAIARRLGFPPEILDRADERVDRTAGDAERMMRDMRDIRVDAERLRGRAEERLVELEQAERDLGTRKKAMEDRRSQLDSEAQRGIEERVESARGWVERGRRLLLQLPAARRTELEAVLKGLEEALADAQMTERRKEFVDGLKKGSFVWLPRFKKRCQIARVYKRDRQLEVKLGLQTMRVSFDDVTFYDL